MEKLKWYQEENYRGGVSMDLFKILMVCMVGILLISIPTIIIDGVFYGTMRAENAMNMCKEQGYGTYLDYQIRPFSTYPYGLRCQNPAIEIKGALPVSEVS